MDFSTNISHAGTSHKNADKHLRFVKLIDKIHMEGTVSQILYLWLISSFCFM